MSRRRAASSTSSTSSKRTEIIFGDKKRTHEYKEMVRQNDKRRKTKIKRQCDKTFCVAAKNYVSGVCAVCVVFVRV